MILTSTDGESLVAAKKTMCPDSHTACRLEYAPFVSSHPPFPQKQYLSIQSFVMYVESVLNRKPKTGGPILKA